MNDKISTLSIAFILNSNIKFGAGTEKVILNYIKYKPEDIKNIILIQIPSIDNSKNRLNDSDLNDLYKSVKIIYISPAHFKVINSLAKFPELRNIPYRMIILDLSLFLLKHTVYRNLYERIGKPDIIYLIRNDYAFFLKKENFIVGSTHAWSAPNNRILKTVDKITGFIFKNNIKAYHAFSCLCRWY